MSSFVCIAGRPADAAQEEEANHRGQALSKRSKYTYIELPEFVWYSIPFRDVYSLTFTVTVVAVDLSTM